MASLVAATLIQWLALASLVMLIGSVSLDLFVLPSTTTAFDDARGSLRRWILFAIAVLFVATLGHLLIRTRTMSGGGLGASITAIPVVLTRTHFGAIWIARFAGLAAITACLAMPATLARPLTFALAAGLGLTTSLTGHASDRGDFSVSVLVDYAHLLAAAIWVGGLFGLAAAVFPRISGAPAPPVVSMVRRFSTLAGTTLAIVVLSGSYNAWIQTRVASALWTTTYGRVLLVKLCLVLVIVGFGAVNRFTVLPRLAGARSSELGRKLLSRVASVGPHAVSDVLRGRLARYVAVEALLGLVVLACTAVLAESTPARHAIRTHHTQTIDDMDHETRKAAPRGQEGR